MKRMLIDSKKNQCKFTKKYEHHVLRNIKFKKVLKISYFHFHILYD